MSGQGRPVRSTAGAMPRRFEDFVLAAPSAVDSPASRSGRSTSGSGSRETVRSQQKKIDVETRSALVQVDKAQLPRRGELALMEARHQNLSRKIQRLHDLCEDLTLSPEEIERFTATRKGLENDLEELTEDLVRAKVEIRFEEEVGEIQKKEIQIQADKDMNKLNSDSDGEMDSEQVDTSDLTLKWASEHQISPPPITPSVISPELNAWLFPPTTPDFAPSIPTSLPAITTGQTQWPWLTQPQVSLPTTTITTTQPNSQPMVSSSTTTITTAALNNPLFATFAKPNPPPLV
ncbi:DNA-directed RNA polymerase subunit beta [Folsomia candida]|uniref:DNA-directed RNA polymerase subunit beta n=1 Tax=Folsomia candida TaxID=158441 RepID=A0A226E9E5_FOLCA|nr:DNA-directed RNA polymerase subunit beta [Folsomia candida]